VSQVWCTEKNGFGCESVLLSTVLDYNVFQFRLMGRPATVIRDVSVTMFDNLKKAGETSDDINSYVLCAFSMIITRPYISKPPGQMEQVGVARAGRCCSV